MKILYLGISSKYIHTMPAGWFLSEYLKSKGITVCEVYKNVNENYEKLLSDILSYDFNKLLISVYIFNVETVRKIIKDIKERRPDTVIIAGGPEVTEDFFADHIVIGEGEKALFSLLNEGGGRVIYGDPFKSLDDIPSPYTDKRLKDSLNKMVYYESSRGCPFRCAYCMAGLTSGVRCFSLERVFFDLRNIVKSGAKIVKFTDRTFNANTERTEAILNFIKDNFTGSGTCFHFEVGGDLFKESTIELLNKMPAGLIQMEAGVQTLNVESLKAVNRTFSEDKFFRNIEKIIKAENIHMHLDLIAGLPYETIETFRESFNKVFSLRPHMLQLGFLKFLKGTPIRESYKAEYGQIAPYEVISTPTMSIEDFKELKKIDFVVDRVYNSGKFHYTLSYLLKDCVSAYGLFLKISRHFEVLNISKNAHEDEITKGLIDYMKGDARAKDILLFDYLITNNSRKIPLFLRTPHSENFKKFLKSIKKDGYTLYEEFHYLPDRENQGNYIVKFDYYNRDSVMKMYKYEIVISI